MDDETKLIAESEAREKALEQLNAAVAACRETDLTRDEILHALDPLFTADDVLIEGDLFDHLEDDDSTEIIRRIYAAIPQGATLSFHVKRRPRSKILAICDDAEISDQNVIITRERNVLRVEITKLQ